MHPDPQGKVVLSVQVIMSRNVRGMRMVPSAGLEDKVEVERLLVDAMLGAEPLRGGDYHPLRGSQSYASKPWMSVEMEQQLKERVLGAGDACAGGGQAFTRAAVGATPVGRPWEALAAGRASYIQHIACEARGVFTGGGIVAWINQALLRREMSWCRAGRSFEAQLPTCRWAGTAGGREHAAGGAGHQ